MHNEPFNKILLAAVILLALGEGYLLYQNSQLRSVPRQTGSVTQTFPRTPPRPALAAPVNAPTTILVPLSGTLEGVSGSTLTLSEQASSTITVAVSSDTAIVQEGIS